MTNYFVLSTDPLSSSQKRKIKDAIRPAAWWQWLPNFWLIRDDDDDLDVEIIRDAIYEIDNTVRCVVLEVEPMSWSALTRKDSRGRDMIDWVRNNWGED